MICKLNILKMVKKSLKISQLIIDVPSDENDYGGDNGS